MAIAEALDKLAENPSAVIEMGAAGYDAVKRKYNWASQETLLLELYKRLAS